MRIEFIYKNNLLRSLHDHPTDKSVHNLGDTQSINEATFLELQLFFSEIEANYSDRF
jgi:hypothetical protein